MSKEAVHTTLCEAECLHWAVRYRLDVKEPSLPLLPRSFHATEEEAFDAGLEATTGQSELATELPAGWDFIIIDTAALR